MTNLGVRRSQDVQQSETDACHIEQPCRLLRSWNERESIFTEGLDARPLVFPVLVTDRMPYPSYLLDLETP